MKQPIRVAYVLTPITFGGTEKVNLNFLATVDPKQIDLHLIVMMRPREEPSLLLDDFDDAALTRWLGLAANCEVYHSISAELKPK